MKAQIFWRVFNRSKAKRLAPEAVRVTEVEVAEDAELVEIIEQAGEAAGKALMSLRGDMGVFEVQTDLGMWARPDGRCVLTRGTEFRSWEQLDAEPD